MPDFLRESPHTSAARSRARLTMTSLLILSLLPVVTTGPLPVGLKDTGPSPANILFIPAFACSSVSVLSLERRTHFNFYDGLQTEAWILRQFRFNFAMESSSVITGYATRFAPHADCANIPIRAPPCRYNRKIVIQS
jgi:hypothetical protein